VIQFNDDFLREFYAGDVDRDNRRYFEFHRRRYEETLATLERLRPPAAGAPPRVLDVGGYPGHLAFAARRLGWQVEIVTESLEGFAPYEAFRRACDRHGLAVETLDAERDFFPYEGSQFDAVLFTEVLEHLAHNPFHTLGEICRVLRPDGALVLTTPNLAGAAHLEALWRQQPIFAPLTSPWAETFPTVPSKRHFREYTAPEVRWLLADQNKDPYRFDRVEVRFSDCWREAEASAGAAGWVAGLLRRLSSRWQGNIFATARKPPNLFLIRGDETVLLDGWYDAEPYCPAVNMPAEAPYPLRWMAGRAELRLPIPPAARERLVGRRVRITLPLRNPVPAELVPVRSLKMSLAESSDEGRPQPVAHSPDMTPIGESFSIEKLISHLHLVLSCETFCPDEYLKNGDRRSLGVQLIQSRIRIEIE